VHLGDGCSRLRPKDALPALEGGVGHRVRNRLDVAPAGDPIAPKGGQPLLHVHLDCGVGVGAAGVVHPVRRVILDARRSWGGGEDDLPEWDPDVGTAAGYVELAAGREAVLGARGVRLLAQGLDWDQLGCAHVDLPPPALPGSGSRVAFRPLSPVRGSPVVALKDSCVPRRYHPCLRPEPRRAFRRFPTHLADSG
jgi:hypothetical protein